MRHEKIYWKSLDDSPDGETTDRGEDDDDDGATRREFLQFLGGAAAGAGLAGCTPNPPRMVVPYVRQPEGISPSVPVHYASTLPHEGFGIGVIVTSFEGR